MEIRNMTAGLASHILDTVSQHKFGSDQNISEKEKILLGLFFIALSLRYVKHIEHFNIAKRTIPK